MGLFLLNQITRIYYNLTSKISRGVMAANSTTKMSSKGQVVIPEEIRNKLGLGPGVQFLVIGEGDVIILKSLSTPSMKDFDRLISKAKKAARQNKIKPSDISRAIKESRSR